MEPWQQLDRASLPEARRLLTTCCGSSAWVERMLRRRPFGSEESLTTAAREAWVDLTHRNTRRNNGKDDQPIGSSDTNPAIARRPLVQHS